MSDATLELVRKLLAKAESTDSEHERDALNAKASDLIARYGIDQALLAAANPHVTLTPGDRIVIVHGPYTLDKAALLNNIAVACRVKTVRTGTSTKLTRMHLFGFDVDLERVELLFTSLLVQASYGLASVRPPEPGGYSFYDNLGEERWRSYRRESVAAYRRSWLAGFSTTIYTRLMEAEARAQAETTTATGSGMELVLVDRNAAVDKAVSLVYPKLTNSGPRRLGGTGYEAGSAAGARADLGQSRINHGSGGRRALA